MKHVQHNKKGQGSRMLVAIVVAVAVIMAYLLLFRGKLDWFDNFFDKEVDFDGDVNGKPYNLNKYKEGCPFDDSDDEKYYDFRKELFIRKKYTEELEALFNLEDLQEQAEETHTQPRISKSDYETIRNNFDQAPDTYTLYTAELLKKASDSCISSGTCTFEQFSKDYFGEDEQRNLEEQCYITKAAAKAIAKEQLEME